MSRQPSANRLLITATLGPASRRPEVVAEMAGRVDRFRINGSHTTDAELERWLETLAGVYEMCGRAVPVVLDLQGSKMRLGQYPTVPRLPEVVALIHAERSEAPETLPVPHGELFAAAAVGERLVLNDARVELEVTGTTDSGLRARVVRNGPLGPFKGINRAEHPISMARLLDRDARQIAASRHLSWIEYAMSFVASDGDALLLRPHTEGHRLIAKIERPEAIGELSAISRAFDEVWFCRGDLGSQAGIENLGRLQRIFAEAIVAMPVPAHLAGQVLHHMTEHAEPTRSEVVHLYDSARLGWAGVVLSDETAVGRSPVGVVELLHRLVGG